MGAGLSAGLGKRAGCRVADTASCPGPGDTVAPTLAEPTEFSCTSMSGGIVRRYLERHHSWETGLGITLIQWGNRGTVSRQYVRTKPLSLRAQRERAVAAFRSTRLLPRCLVPLVRLPDPNGPLASSQEA